MKTQLKRFDSVLLCVTEQRKDFLIALVPFCQRIQRITYAKANEFGVVESPAGILTSIIVADIIVQSEFGEHPLAQRMYDRRIYGNNLNLSESNEWWAKDRSSVLIDGIEYKCFESQQEFANNQTDEYITDKRFLPALRTNDFNKQLSTIRKTKRRSEWSAECRRVVDRFQLREFDYGEAEIKDCLQAC